MSWGPGYRKRDGRGQRWWAEGGCWGRSGAGKAHVRVLNEAADSLVSQVLMCCTSCNARSTKPWRVFPVSQTALAGVLQVPLCARTPLAHGSDGRRGLACAPCFDPYRTSTFTRAQSSYRIPTWCFWLPNDAPVHPYRCRFAHDPDARQRWAERASRGGGGGGRGGDGSGRGRGRGYGSGGGRTGAGGYDYAAEFIIGRVREWGGKLPHTCMADNTAYMSLVQSKMI